MQKTLDSAGLGPLLQTIGASVSLTNECDACGGHGWGVGGVVL